MKLAVRIAIVVLPAAAGFLLVKLDTTGHAAPGNAASYSAAVATQAVVKDVRRIGINLGVWTYWGAEQISANILKNPGFEGMLDRAIVLVHAVGPKTFSDDQSWTGRPDGFWKGAIAEARTGKAAGRQTRIVHSIQNGKLGLPSFETADDLGVEQGDVVAITRVDDASLPAGWWIPPESGGAITVESDHRPGSSGVRSLALRTRANRSTEVVSYLDTITNRAGKMLPVIGKWRIRFWAKAPDGPASVRVRFFRQGATPFLDETITPADTWRQETVEFAASDSGPAGPLEFHLQASGSGGRVLVDDVDLRDTADSSAFRTPVIEALQKLHPGFIRDWQGQLGDTFENRVGDDSARRTSRYRPGDANSSDYFYSVGAVLDLCRRVGADPWLVAPTTFGDAEWSGLGRFLAQQYRAGGFSEILVEFGNENWNRLFRNAAISDPQAHGRAAQRAVQLLRAAAGADLPLRFVINGQHVNPTYTAQFVDASPSADIVAIAPYFFQNLSRNTSTADAFRGLFAGDEGHLRQIAARNAGRGKETAVYEVNVHTMGGDAPQSQRDPVVAGRVAAAALAKTMLDGFANGIRRQCAWTLSGFDVQIGADYARLFGVVRDFGETGRFRPSGLAIQMLNEVAPGDYYPISGIPAESGVSAYAFLSRAGWSVAVVSSSPAPQEVAISVPGAGSAVMPSRMYELAAETPNATNEDSEGVRIVESVVKSSGRTVTVELSPYAFAILTPHAASFSTAGSQRVTQ